MNTEWWDAFTLGMLVGAAYVILLDLWSTYKGVK